MDLDGWVAVGFGFGKIRLKRHGMKPVVALDKWSLTAAETDQSIRLLERMDIEVVELADDFMPELCRRKLATTPVTHLITRRHYAAVNAKADATEEYDANNPPYLVKPEWLLVSCRRSGDNGDGNQLEPEQFYSTNPSRIFSAMHVCLGDLLLDDRHLLVAYVEEFGGQWSDELEPWTTHLVVMRPQGPLYLQAVKQAAVVPQTAPDKGDDSVEMIAEESITATAADFGSSGIRVVLPHFFEDCVKLRRRIPEDEYQFPNPPLLRTDMDRTTAAQQKCHPSGQENTLAPPFSTKKSSSFSAPRPVDKPFLDPKRFVVYVDPDSRIQSSVLAEYLRLLTAAGASVADSYDSQTVTHVICNLQGTLVYQQVTAEGKIIGTIYWLLELLRSHLIPSPRSRLLFHPWPAQTVPKMDQLRISISNYTSLSREIIKTMIINMGAQYTSQLTPDNTHLICAAAEGEKYRKAQEWNVNVVNHLWIEDCWQHWTMQALTRPQYLVHRMSLARVVGDLPVPAGFDQLGAPTKSLSVESLFTNNRVFGGDVAADADTPSNGSRIKTHSRKRIRTSDAPTAVVSRPLHPKKDNVAADSSVLFIDPLMDHDDFLHSPLQMQPEHPNGKSSATRKSLTSSPISPVHYKPRYMVTGFTLDPRKQRELRHLGAKETTDIKECTHLIATKILRTEKLLAAIATCPFIVADRWIDESIRAGKLLDPRDFPLFDQEAEREYGFKWRQTLALAAERKLFDGYTVFVGSSVKPGIEVLKNLVEIHGGHCFPLKNFTRRYESLDKDRIILVANAEDIQGQKLVDDLSLPIHNSEFILLGILRQELPIYDEIK